MKFAIKDSFSKCDQTHRKLQIWSHLLKKSLMENLFFLCSESVITKKFQQILVVIKNKFATAHLGQSLQKWTK